MKISRRGIIHASGQLKSNTDLPVGELLVICYSLLVNIQALLKGARLQSLGISSLGTCPPYNPVLKAQRKSAGDFRSPT